MQHKAGSKCVQLSKAIGRMSIGNSQVKCNSFPTKHHHKFLPDHIEVEVLFDRKFSKREDPEHPAVCICPNSSYGK